MAAVVRRGSRSRAGNPPSTGSFTRPHSMLTNNGLPLVAPRVTPVLDPAFRPAVLANRGFRALVAETPGAVPVGVAIEQTDGSVFRSQLARAAGLASARGRQRRLSGALRQVPAVVARRMAPARRWTGPTCRGVGRALPRHGDRTIRRRVRGRADVRSSARDRGTRATLPAERSAHDAARPPPRRLPDRLRPRRQRPQGRGGDRRPVVFSEETVWDPVSQARSAVPLRRDHGLAAQGRRAPAARGRHRRQRRRRVRQQPGQGRLAVPRRAAGPLRRAREGPVPRGPASVGRRAVRGGQRRRGHGAGRIDVAWRERRSSASRSAPAPPPATSRRTATSRRGSNELAFVPIDYNPGAPVDEWSGDYGVGSQYFSQQCVGRLLPVAGIDAPSDLRAARES